MIKTKTEAIIFDIDGTLLDIEHRIHFLTQNPIDWDSFLDPEIISKDTAIPSSVKIANQMAKAYPIIFVTGRNEGIRDITCKQLESILDIGKNYVLLMRQDGDHRLDTVIKHEIYSNLIEPSFDIIGIFEDKTSVTEMWRELGLKVFQVEPPKAPDGF